MKPMQQSWRSLPHAFRSALSNHTAKRRFQRPPIRHGSSLPVSEPKFDQTKESNDPSKPARPEHETQVQKSGFSADVHPAKQPDPQQSPSKATGIETEGPDSKAGEGQDMGVTKDRGAGPFMKQ